MPALPRRLRLLQRLQVGGTWGHQGGAKAMMLVVLILAPSRGVCERCREGWDPAGDQCLPPQARCTLTTHLITTVIITSTTRECMPGMYRGSGTCLACHASCSTCDGSKAKDCTTCYPDHR